LQVLAAHKAKQQRLAAVEDPDEHNSAGDDEGAGGSSDDDGTGSSHGEGGRSSDGEQQAEADVDRDQRGKKRNVVVPKGQQASRGAAKQLMAVIQGKAAASGVP
jgi:hypothetical protein